VKRNSKTAKDTALNSLVFAFDTKAKTLGRILNYEYYGYPRDFIQQYQRALEAVTRADVLRAAKRYLARGFHHRGRGQPEQSDSRSPARAARTALDLTSPSRRNKRSSPMPPAWRKAVRFWRACSVAVAGAANWRPVKDFTVTQNDRFDPAPGRWMQ